ncbi:peptidoglycan DD-metalloendopeptidase family protein [Ekhidna sp. To15]|uniref:peptidoglycan DD-metalloendopeptidase family protein n=1 Tax=Ekhidna sp. To15 TaxID=3395267 RepID=UPI003F51B415
MINKQSIILSLIILNISCSNKSDDNVIADSDSDGIEDILDNCPKSFNPDQEDQDDDGIGDICDDNNNISITSFPHIYETIVLQNPNMPDIADKNSNYDFAFPVLSDSWTSESYSQDDQAVIWIGQYGLRYLSGNESTNRQDMHGGMDTNKKFISNNVNFDCDEGSPASVYSLCDGMVYDFRSEKNDVYIECDQLLEYADGTTSTLRNVYRHMSSVKAEVQVTQETYRIAKGEYIGEMGSKGANNCHLHLDLKNEDHYLHPGRLFNPKASPYYQALQSSTDVDIRMLGFSESNNEVYFRIGIRGNILSVLSIKIENEKIDLSETLNFEKRQEIESTSERDNSVFDHWSIFAYPFNGFANAQIRYENVKDDLPEIYPGSNKREKPYPISSEDHTLYGEASLVYDIVVNDVGRDVLSYFNIQICDLYGNCISIKE